MYKYFLEDIFYIRKVIWDFKLDIVYVEFRIVVIVVLKFENIKVVIGFSYFV